jgi:hypothetical protein
MEKRQTWLMVIVFWLGPVLCSGQTGQQKSPWFRSINGIGLLTGEVSAAIQFQTVNGIQYKSWFMGAGAGLDFYRYRTIPVFLDLRKEFGRSKTPFFVYFDGGYSIPWLSSGQKDNYGMYKYAGGLYTDAGLGFSYKISPRRSIFISAGYSYKNLKQNNVTVPQACPLNAICDYAPNDYYYGGYDYDMNRLTLKTGFSF